ncbi:MAG: T9SS type A sorting domain-containing protein [Candidatus Marinimicrobia bacterium]|nr:T9SS type A sorting domain-containing protein [Candidatus Neomarinimicrobiota bacterium]MCF7904405.1 T9SS type A sorting domain-containing protein [Candidatus Neomarinimicrobiota bacterium]
MADDYDDEFDKCGILDHSLSRLSLQVLGDHWGYGYDSLLIDLERWAQSPYVRLDSLGTSVQGRTLWEMTITGPDSTTTGIKPVVYVHARTHPNEVQAWWVTREMIKILLSQSSLGRHLRDNLIFHIIPMYNPDGVELEYPRQNANYVDIESNWYSTVLEPEVQVLRNRFVELMNSETPVDVALNMHSSISGTRFFVCHDQAGTSPLYFDFEKRYIGEVRSFYPHGIEPWYYSVTWTAGTPLRYPESWWWLNHHEDVMALTYEDNNSMLASAFDTTAAALLNGSYEYIYGHPVSIDGFKVGTTPREARLIGSYPNPFNRSTKIQIDLQIPGTLEMNVYNLRGERVTSFRQDYAEPGLYQLSWQALDAAGQTLPSGMYICRLLHNSRPKDALKLLLLK